MRSLKIGLIASAFVALSMSGTEARSDTWVGGGINAVYPGVPADQVEFISSPDRIISVRRAMKALNSSSGSSKAPASRP